MHVGRFLLYSISVVLCPLGALANVHVSEVAWMGTVDNANAEWIELYNDGPAQSVEGWTLVADDGQPALVLTGTLPPEGYVLLERSSDDTVPTVRAFMLYTGALGNGGEVLELRNADGGVEDRVVGGEAWELGGDNETKDTLQRQGTPAVGSWVTASATPGAGGALPSAGSDSADADGARSVGDVSVLEGAARERGVVRMDPALVVDAGGDRTATVGVAVPFAARTYKERGKEIPLKNAVWSFGDGGTAAGREVSHTYQYTGEYVVHVHAHRDGFLDEVSDSDQIVVRVVEPAVAVTYADTAYIEITNTSNHELDVSGYTLGVGSTHFRLPPGTILLPQASVRFPRHITGLSAPEGVTTGIFFPNDTLAHTYRSERKDAPVQQVVAVPAQAQTVRTAVDHVPAAPTALSDAPVTQPLTMSHKEGVPSLAQMYGAEHSVMERADANLLWWLLGLLGAALTAIVVVLLVRHEQEEVIKGYEIIEEDG